jgi:hypothetical protein
MTREVTLIVEPKLHSDIRDGPIAAFQQLHRTFDPATAQEPHRRFPGADPETSSEVETADRRELRKVFQLDVVTDVVVEILPDTT